MKTFRTLFTLFIGSILGFIVAAMSTSYSNLEAEKGEWQSKINELEIRLDKQLAGVSENVTKEVSYLITKRMDDLDSQEQLQASKWDSKINGMESQINGQLVEVSDKVTSLVSARTQGLVKQEKLFQEKIDLLPKLVSSEVSSIFPLEVKDLGDGVQLATAKMPQELEAFLDSLSQITANKVITAQELYASREQVSSAVNQLPAPRRQALADQIALAEWSLNALDLLSEGTSSSELLSQLILAQTLTESVPLFAPTGLDAAVQQRAESLAGEAEKQIVQLTDLDPVPSLDALRNGALIADFMGQSGMLDDATAANQLEIRLQVAEWLNGYKNLKREAYGSQEEFDLARYNLVEDGSAVVALAVNLEVNLPSGFIPSLREYSKRLAEEQRIAQGKKRAGYQIWALGQIEQADKMIAATGAKNIENWLKEAKDDPEGKSVELLSYLNEEQAPKFRNALLKAANEEGASITTVDRYNLPLVIKSLDGLTSWEGQSEMAKALTADALLLNLMVIDETLLDRPVAALYSQAFQEAWTYLEGTDYRMKVAKEGAAISKKQLSE